MFFSKYPLFWRETESLFVRFTYLVLIDLFGEIQNGVKKAVEDLASTKILKLNKHIVLVLKDAASSKSKFDTKLTFYHHFQYFHK